MAHSPKVTFTRLSENPNNGYRKTSIAEMPMVRSILDACKIIETRQGSARYDVIHVRYTGNPKQYWESKQIESGITLEDARKSAKKALQTAWRRANPPF